MAENSEKELKLEPDEGKRFSSCFGGIEVFEEDDGNPNSSDEEEEGHSVDEESSQPLSELKSEKVEEQQEENEKSAEINDTIVSKSKEGQEREEKQGLPEETVEYASKAKIKEEKQSLSFSPDAVIAEAVKKYREQCQCKICDLMFTSPRYVEQHFKKVHVRFSDATEEYFARGNPFFQQKLRRELLQSQVKGEQRLSSIADQLLEENSKSSFSDGSDNSPPNLTVEIAEKKQAETEIVDFRNKEWREILKVPKISVPKLGPKQKREAIEETPDLPELPPVLEKEIPNDPVPSSSKTSESIKVGKTAKFDLKEAIKSGKYRILKIPKSTFVTNSSKLTVCPASAEPKTTEDIVKEVLSQGSAIEKFGEGRIPVSKATTINIGSGKKIVKIIAPKSSQLKLAKTAVDTEITVEKPAKKLTEIIDHLSSSAAVTKSTDDRKIEKDAKVKKKQKRKATKPQKVTESNSDEEASISTDNFSHFEEEEDFFPQKSPEQEKEETPPPRLDGRTRRSKAPKSFANFYQTETKTNKFREATTSGKEPKKSSAKKKKRKSQVGSEDSPSSTSKKRRKSPTQKNSAVEDQERLEKQNEELSELTKRAQSIIRSVQKVFVAEVQPNQADIEVTKQIARELTSEYLANHQICNLSRDQILERRNRLYLCVVAVVSGAMPLAKACKEYSLGTATVYPYVFRTRQRVVEMKKLSYDTRLLKFRKPETADGWKASTDEITEAAIEVLDRAKVVRGTAGMEILEAICNVVSGKMGMKEAEVTYCAYWPKLHGYIRSTRYLLGPRCPELAPGDDVDIRGSKREQFQATEDGGPQASTTKTGATAKITEGREISLEGLGWSPENAKEESVQSGKCSLKEMAGKKVPENASSNKPIYEQAYFCLLCGVAMQKKELMRKHVELLHEPYLLLGAPIEKMAVRKNANFAADESAELRERKFWIRMAYSKAEVGKSEGAEVRKQLLKRVVELLETWDAPEFKENWLEFVDTWAVENSADEIPNKNFHRAFFGKGLPLPKHCRKVRMKVELERGVEREMFQYACDLCTDTFPDRTQIVQHLNSRHKVKEMYFSCPLCKEEFQVEKERNAHVQEFHAKNFNRNCP